MRRVALSALLLGTLTAVATAQEARPRVEERRPPGLLVKPGDGGPSEPLGVVKAHVQVVSAGGLATTVLDLTFANPHDRILEGELFLPLPQGATVSSFALEVGDKLRSASVVEKEKARVVFEELVRKGIDPGLVEWVKGNSFRTRVYPIPARGTKRVVIGYDQELLGNYVLPIAFPKLAEFSVDVSVWGSEARPEAAGALELVFAKSGDCYRATFAAKDTLPKDLRLEIVPPAREVLVEKARVKSAVGNQPELVWVARAACPPAPNVQAAFPRRVTIVYDASGSAAGRDHARERAFLEQLFARQGQASVQLVLFSNEVWSKGESFEVKEGKADALLARLAAIKPDGGTRLGCLDLTKWEASTDHFLLLSDGLTNFGEGELKPGTKPMSCVTSGSVADFARLEKLSRRGAFLDLATTDPKDAVERLLVRQLVLEVGFDAARVTDVVAPVRCDGDRVTVAGRVRAGDRTRVTLRFLRGGAEVAKEDFELDPAALSSSGKVERVWATRRIAELLEDGKAREADVVKLGKAHGVVTPHTSLLVLDTLADYVKYRVVPPADMEEEYWKIVEGQKQVETKTREERLARVRAKWVDRVEWWKKEFKVPDGFKVPTSDKSDGAPGGSFGGVPGERRVERGAARPSAPPPAAASPARDSANGPSADGDEAKEKKEEGSSGKARGGRDAVGKIQLKAWDPQTPYLAAMKTGKDVADSYRIYLEQRASYVASTAFYLDCADFFFNAKDPVLGTRVLSNLAELNLESAPLLRILAYRLQQAGAIDLAVTTFREVARLRPEEPQTWRDLGLALAEAKDYPAALENLARVVTGVWDGRFPDIELIVLGELNEVVRHAKADGKDVTVPLPQDLVRALDYDLRIILNWDADACDMDLWVVEPSGEKAFYGNHHTQIGGRFGEDFTRGYGPEEYLIKKAPKGTFKLQVNYYGNTQQILAGDTTIQLTIVKNYGRPSEERIAVTRRLKGRQEVLDIAEVAFSK